MEVPPHVLSCELCKRLETFLTGRIFATLSGGGAATRFVAGGTWVEQDRYNGLFALGHTDALIVCKAWVFYGQLTRFDHSNTHMPEAQINYTVYDVSRDKDLLEAGLSSQAFNKVDMFDTLAGWCT